MARFVPLDSVSHRNLRVSWSCGVGFAAQQPFAPFVLREIKDIAREFPIVFGPDSMPCALLAIEPGYSPFVSADRQWLGSYLPSYLAGYPFQLRRLPGEAQSSSDKLALLFDREAPHFVTGDGEPVFTENGQLSPTVLRSVENLKRFQESLPATLKAVEALQVLGLFAEKKVRVRTSSAREHQVVGINIIEESRFHGLDDQAFITLRQAGALPLVYAHFHSHANLRRGMLVGEQVEARTVEAAQSAAQLMDESTINFSRF